MPRKRLNEPGAASVLASGVCAGSMDSRNGRARVVPTPRRNVRRGMCFFVMNIIGSYSTDCKHKDTRAQRHKGTSIRSAFGNLGSHLEWGALDDPHQDRREPVVVLFRIVNDGPNHRHVVILDAPA